jgi:hypothetical protein
MRRRVEVYLDQGHGGCYLRDANVANLVQHALLFHDQVKYRLSAWVLMPNHAHMRAFRAGAPYTFGNKIGSATSAVNMQRAL